ncbi:hypothetical protein N7447_008320 [Penicillium robsamsonii]|uniref:uncharacterized protein n=1 Tax=Penicillium robsamsonii TaxID=1792511 RepID=UPI00254868CD|nr:uncharacterized protein N7447_008320 [Penicillium robsamsonii]KAJ5816087.1 hypothetical protein N7447_008320 [Penicillium robsamsonii]
MATGPSPHSMAEGNTPSTVTLHILCQSLPPPSRFTLDNVPLSSTIAQLKSRIEQSFPNNPQASHQRLIYRGKPLTVDEATLSAVVSAMEEGTYSMHLVLPPEPAQTEVPPVSAMSHGSPLGNSTQPSSSSSTWLNPDTSGIASNTSAYSSIPRTMSAIPASPHITFNQYVHNSSPNQHSATIHAPEADGAESSPLIHTLRGRIVEIEGQLDRRIMPSMENIIRIRNQLLEIQDRRSASQLPLPGVAELVARILDAQQRARLMEYMQQQQLQTQHSQTGVHVHSLADPQNGHQVSHQGTTSQFFMLASPTGDHNSIVRQSHSPSRPAPQQTVSPNTVLAGASGAPQAPQSPPAYQAPQAYQVPQAPNQNAAVVQNALRQAILNQQRRDNNVEHAGLARHIRRIWLFTRLWLFCYLTSAPGTWRRYIFVSIALLVSFFSETNIPRQLATLVISPIQRHLEGLTHAGGLADRATQNGANNVAEFSIWDQVRRAERALVLLFASLVPGLGEGHVRARTAADQAFVAEQERQAREREEQEQARDQERQEQEQAQPGVVEDAGNSGIEQEVPAARAQSEI